MNTGVYQWRNTVNGKVYVGSASTSLTLRRRVHRSSLRGGYHANKYLQAAWVKYGETAFVFEVLEECEPDSCVSREQHWMDVVRASDRRFGYNLTPRAGGTRGFKWTEEAKARMAASLKGRRFTETHRARLSAASKGVPKSPEHRAKCANARKGKTPWNKGKKMSADYCVKAGNGRRGKPGPNKGGVMSEDHRLKLCGERRGGRGRQKLNKKSVVEIRGLLALSTPQYEIAERFGVSGSTVSNIAAGRIWKWVEDPS